MSEQVIDLGVRNIDLTKKSNLMLPQTQKVAENLKAEIYVDTIWAKTLGNGYVIAQESISSEETKTTILQETEDRQFVAMETVHPSNEDVSKQFERKKRTTVEYKITMYPMYLGMALLTILYSILIYKTGVKKEPIIIESSQWLDIFLISTIFIMAEAFIYYWISTQMIDKTIFKSFTRPKNKTYQIRHNGKVQSITCTYFHGFFFTLRTANAKKIWGFSVNEVEEYLRDPKDDVSFVKKINEAISIKLQYEQKIISAYQIYQMKQHELDNIEAEFIKNVPESELESEIEELVEEDPSIKTKREELNKMEKNYNAIRDKYYPLWEKKNEEIKDLKNSYNQALNRIMGDAKDNKAREMLLNSEKHIMKLKHENTLMITKIIRLQNFLQNAYDEGLIRSDQVMEHVYSLVQEEGSRKYEINYRIENNNGTQSTATQSYHNGNGKVYSNGQQNNNVSGSYSLDLTPVVKIAAIVAGAVAIIYAMGWAIPTILQAFGGITFIGVLAMFAFLFIALLGTWAIFKMTNQFADSANNRTALKLN